MKRKKAAKAEVLIIPPSFPHPTTPTEMAKMMDTLSKMKFTSKADSLGDLIEWILNF